MNAPMTNMPHIPVMLAEVTEALAPTDREVYIDGTFGAGGYTSAILDHADCIVIAIDRDESASAAANDLKSHYGERLVFVNACFGDVEQVLEKLEIESVDGFVLDLGVSSMQIDQPERGFSFRFDGDLDMRMGGEGKTAADIVNTYEEEDLANLIYKYGDERYSRRVAKNIVKRRAEKPFATTLDLADIIRASIPKSPKDKIDPATRTFQALRIAVNDELGELERALQAAEKILKPGGRMVVVTFHSLEDRMVKTFFREKSGTAPSVSRYMPDAGNDSPAIFDLISKKPVSPGEEEIAKNSRARSARLRAVVKRDPKGEAA